MCLGMRWMGANVLCSGGLWLGMRKVIRSMGFRDLDSMSPLLFSTFPSYFSPLTSHVNPPP